MVQLLSNRHCVFLSFYSVFHQLSFVPVKPAGSVHSQMKNTCCLVHVDVLLIFCHLSCVVVIVVFVVCLIYGDCGDRL